MKNDDTDENEHVRSEYRPIGMAITNYVPSLVKPWRVGATTKSTATVPQVVGTKEQPIDDERRNRTCTMQI